MRYAIALTFSAALLTAGCNKTPPGGGTGNSGGSGSHPVGGASDTFDVKMPSSTIPTTIKQGTSEVVKLTLDRGKDFKDGVKLKIETPDKVKADYKETIPASDPPEVAVKLEVDKAAALGEHTIKVTATPDKGKATSGEFKIKVTAP